MFNIECIIYSIIVLYSLFYQLRVLFLYKSNSKVAIKDGSGLYVSKDILSKNNLATLYVTKIKGKYNDHYDIERNVIRLSEDVYEKENLSSMIMSFYQVIKALSVDKNKRKEEKIKTFVLDWSNKIAFVLFILGAASKAIDIMTLSIIMLVVVLVMKYNEISKKSEYIDDNLKYLKKEYKLDKKQSEEVEKCIKVLLYNELSLHIFNNKY